MRKILIILTVVLPVILKAQPVAVSFVDNSANFPSITWMTASQVDTTAFQIFRASIKDKVFKEIHTIHSTNPALKEGDTTFFYVVDTTLTSKGFYFYYINILRGGKNITSESAVGHNFGLIPPPQLNSFKATPLKDRKAVKLEWKLSYTETVSSMTLYRSKGYDTGFIKIADLSPKITTFTDVIPTANEPWFYFMKIKTWFGNTIITPRIHAFATFAEKPFVPHNINGYYRNDSIVIDWTNVGKNIVGYRVYRSIGEKPFQQLNEMTENIAENARFVDNSEAVKKAIKLRYYVRNVSDGFVESNSSDTLSFYLADHVPVLPPNVLDYVTTPENYTKLLWVPPKTESLIYYNVFISSGNGEPQQLNKQPLQQNWFVDSVYRKAGKYQYEVESIGYNQKKSKNKATITVYRYSPKIHVIIDLKRKNNGIQVSWKRPLNPHIDKIKLYRRFGNNPAVLYKTFSPDADVTYIDKAVTRGTTYLYSLKAGMENGEEVILNNGVEIGY